MYLGLEDAIHQDPAGTHTEPHLVLLGLPRKGEDRLASPLGDALIACAIGLENRSQGIAAVVLREVDDIRLGFPQELNTLTSPLNHCGMTDVGLEHDDQQIAARLAEGDGVVLTGGEETGQLEGLLEHPSALQVQGEYSREELRGPGHRAQTGVVGADEVHRLGQALEGEGLVEGLGAPLDGLGAVGGLSLGHQRPLAETEHRHRPAGQTNPTRGSRDGEGEDLANARNYG